ncbi:hypothetical protein ACFMQL_17190 [Nonomuraea fastidiosa]|uniref:hypothetical protein n=1 Tax=Nonomuraea TaxID=83681 RepID=UPI003249EC66
MTSTSHFASRHARRSVPFLALGSGVAVGEGDGDAEGEDEGDGEEGEAEGGGEEATEDDGALSGAAASCGAEPHPASSTAAVTSRAALPL